MGRGLGLHPFCYNFALLCLGGHYSAVYCSTFSKFIGPFLVSLTDQLEHLTVRCVVGSGVSNVDKTG